ncbi:MAG TPA: class I tRNA ligase family protein, partial [Candidatus Paceibacterota bacterium]|nr:class I tRNA ligase family protein [Candidatus Paceibacterota bacterium]
VWYRGDELYVGTEAPSSDGWEQDPDVLDTWFSSALWTFSTLGWPEETSDMARFHPTDVLETGYDILFFWVARMVLMSGFLLGTVPFKTVFLHGLVRDEKGRKLSKSLGNNIDPIDMIQKYGADAVRLSLIVGMAPGTDSKISENKIRGYKHFTNKVWNIARFVIDSAGDATPGELVAADERHREELHAVAHDVTKHIDDYRIDLAADRLYHYVWHTFADDIIEESKPILKDGDARASDSRKRLLMDILKTSLTLLHPFMPFITEEIWGHLPETGGKLLMVSPWPAH